MCPLGGFKRRADTSTFFDVSKFFELKPSDQNWRIVTRAVAFRGYLNSEPRGGRYR